MAKAKAKAKRRSRAAKRTRDVTFHSPYQEKRCGNAWCVRKVHPKTPDGKPGKREVIRLHTAVNVSTALAEVDRLYHEQLDYEAAHTATGNANGTEAAPANRKRIEESLDLWLRDKVEDSEIRASTLADLKVSVRMYAGRLAALGVEYVDEVAYEHIGDLIKNGPRARKARTRIKHFTHIKDWLGWCRARDRRFATDRNPCEEYRIPGAWRRAAKKARSTGKALTHDQCVRLLEACRTPTEKTVEARTGPRAGVSWGQTYPPGKHLFSGVLLALRTGLRHGNIVRLRWRHINLHDGILIIGPKEMKADAPFEVPLHPEALSHLRDLLRKRNEDRGRAPLPDDFVFPGIQGRRTRLLEPLIRAFHRAGLDTEVARFRFHDLRHTFAAHLAAHVPFLALQQLMGHSRTSVTSQYGQKLDIEVLRKMLAERPWFFAPATPQAQPGDGSAR